MILDDAIKVAGERPAAYVVASSDLSYFYKGSARNLKERMKDHRAGRVSRTKNRRPLLLVYYKYFMTYSEARQMETYLKTGAGRDWLAIQLKKDMADCSAAG